MDSNRLLDSQGNITGNLSTNGWAKLPNGLILQWAEYTRNDPYPFKFPIPFPNECFGVYSGNISNPNGETNYYIYWQDKTSFQIHCDEDWIDKIRIFAVGY